MRFIVPFLLGMAFVLSCGSKNPVEITPDPKPTDNTEFYRVDPLFKVVRNSVPTRVATKLADPLIHAARGEYVSIQYIVKPSENIIGLSIGAEQPTLNGAKLEVTQKGFVDYVGTSHPVANRMVPTGLVSSSNEYPDPIITDRNVDIPANQTQPLWLTIKVPVNAAEGTYTSKVKIKYFVKGKSYEKAEDISVKVYPVDVEKQNLLVTNLFNGEPDILRFLNKGQTVERYSTRHWELLEVVAKFIAPYRQNIVMVSPKDLAIVTHNQSTGKYSFDFSRMDQWLEIFDRVGINKAIEGGMLWFPKDGDMNEYHAWIPLSNDGNGDSKNIQLTQLAANDPRAISYFEQFLPALKQHLVKKGVYGKYMQHVVDEPPPALKPAYNRLVALTKRIVPDMKVIEAIMFKTDVLLEGIDIWVPKLDDLEANYDSYYKQIQQNPTELWYYVCNEPVGKWANRYIEQELIYTRLSHWINYKYNMPGFLHWALATWSLLAPSSDMNKVFHDPSQDWIPAGDGHITYPGDNKMYSSIRFEAMREGIQDYELLKKLDAMNPVLAKQLANEVVQGFGTYNTNISDFRKTRVKILEALAGK